MMKFSFSPNKSVGEIEFGFNRLEIRKILSGFKGEFKKNRFSKNAADEFECCYVYYDINDKCNAVEFFAPSEICYSNKNLFELNIQELKSLFPDMVEEYGNYYSKKYSVGISFDENIIESILVGCKDYYA